MKKNCRHYFVAVNAIVLEILSTGNVYWTMFNHRAINIWMFIPVIVNGSLLWGIFQRKAFFLWPWLLYYFFVVGIMTMLSIDGNFFRDFRGADVKFIVFFAAIYTYFVCLLIAVVFQYKAIRRYEKEDAQKAPHFNESDVNVEAASDV